MAAAPTPLLTVGSSTLGSGRMNGIIPRSEAKGTDICATLNYYYIIRSDLGCYMQTSYLNKGSEISIFSLHPSCQNGEHYVADENASTQSSNADENGYFYILKGDSYRRVKDLTTDSDAKVYELHPNCQGGDHYLSHGGNFYIIFQEKGTYRRTKDMNQDLYPLEHDLHPNCRNGLYYWGNRSFNTSLQLPSIVSHTSIFYTWGVSFIKPVSEWGVEFCVCLDVNEDVSKVLSVHPDVLNFLPGGLSVTKGPASGIWENIKTITNDSNTPLTWTKKIKIKVGYNKQKMSQITHNWKISTKASIESGELARSIAKSQLSLSAEYGGSHVCTKNESWNEETEVEEQITLELKPKHSLYLWQYKLCLGKESLLFCRDLKITNDPNPPTEVPLPPAQS